MIKQPEKTTKGFCQFSKPNKWYFQPNFRDIHKYKVPQTVQMKLTLLCVWAEQAILGSAKTALKFKYEI